MPRDAESKRIRRMTPEASASTEAVSGSSRPLQPENRARSAADGGAPADVSSNGRARDDAAPDTPRDGGLTAEAPFELPGALPAVYTELRRIAARQLEHERPDHTLQPTALVNEAYVRLAACGGRFASRTVFLAMAAGVIRHILIDHARARRTIKRGGPGAQRMALDTTILFASRPVLDVLELHDALERLAVVDARAARVVELRYFGGLTVEETAETLGVSSVTVQTDWRAARAWLRRALAP